MTNELTPNDRRAVADRFREGWNDRLSGRPPPRRADERFFEGRAASRRSTVMPAAAA